MTTTVNGTTITISGTYITSGYGINAAYTAMTLTATGTIGGDGLFAAQAETITNDGFILTNGHFDGINLEAGGSVNNYGTIAAYNNGVIISVGSGQVINQGTIEATATGASQGYGVQLTAGSGNQVINGSASDRSALIQAYHAAVALGGAGTVENFGTLNGTGRYGVLCKAQCSIVNGSVQDETALISGGVYGILSGGTSVIANYGTIIATDLAIGVTASATVTNGSPTDVTAFIESQFEAVLLQKEGVTTNFGTIESTGQPGVLMEQGGTITNGSAGSTRATIEGLHGAVYVEGGPAQVTNFGTLVSHTNFISVAFKDGGTLVNGSSGDRLAFVQDVYIVGGAATVTNAGTISAALDRGIYFGAGGTITNGGATNVSALVEGTSQALLAHGVTNVVNFGTMLGEAASAVALDGGGSVVNGAPSSVGATIEGYHYGVYVGTSAGKVTNFGTVRSVGETATENTLGVKLEDGGGIFNGSATDKTAQITGYSGGVWLASGSVANYGTLAGLGEFSHGAQLIYSYGAYLESGGTVTNGGLHDGTAVIEGWGGVAVLSAAGTVANFGTIEGDGGNNPGVLLQDGGKVTNGALGKSLGLINGGTGVVFGALGTIANFGTIEGDGRAAYLADGGVVTNFGMFDGAGGAGVALVGTGTIVNGGPTSTTAVIEGYGVAIAGAGLVKLVSYGTILGLQAPSGYAVELGGGSSVTNGGVRDGMALIEGVGGINITNGPGTVTNLGTIEALGVGVSAGVQLVDGGSVTNGVAGRSLGLIEGSNGVLLVGAGTVTNFGTITADGSAAICLSSGGTVTNFGTIAGTNGAYGVSFKAGGLLVAEAGSDFIGSVIGGGGTLEVLGSGTLSGLLNGGNVTVSGSLPTPTAFTAFNTVDVGAGASFVVAGNGTIASGETLAVVGTLSEAGTLAIAGSLNTSGTIAGTGTVVLGGTATLNAGTSLTIANLAITGGTSNLKASLAYAGSFSQSGGTDAIGVTTLTLNGAAAFSGGTVSGTGGGLLVTTAAVQLSAFDLTVGAVWQNSGMVTDTGPLTLGSSGHSGSFANLAGGIFDITANGGGVALAAANSGSSSNAGLFEKTGGTGLGTVAGNVANTGTILVTAGTLDLTGAVSGTGKGTIGTSGTLEFAGSVAATQTIAFAGATGALVLADPSGTGLSFSGLISAFAGSDQLDLSTIAYAGTQASWAQSGSSGTLTVTEGSETAKIKLFGQYASGNFKAASDGATGTLITFVAGPAHPITTPHAGT